MCMCGYGHMNADIQRPEEGIRSPGAGITGSCEPPDVDAGN